MKDKVVVGYRMFGRPEDAKAFADGLPDDEDLLLNRNEPMGHFTHVKYVDGTEPRKSEPFSDRPPTDADIARLEADESKARQHWDGLTNEEAAIPHLIEEAINAFDAAEVTRLQGRKATIKNEIIMAEIAYLRAKLQVMYAQKAQAKAQREKLAHEAVALGKEAGYPKGKQAFLKAQAAYESARYSAGGTGIGEIMRRIDALMRELRS